MTSWLPEPDVRRCRVKAQVEFLAGERGTPPAQWTLAVGDIGTSCAQGCPQGLHFVWRPGEQ
jgi:hypothetical protein